MKNKIIEKMKKIDLILIIMLAFVVKIIAFGTDFATAMAFFPLAALYSYHRYLRQNQVRNVNTEVIQKINNMQSAIDSLKIQQGVRPSEKTKIRKF